MSAMKSACGEYECPCHDALPVERAKVERMRKALDEIIERLQTTPKHGCAGYLCACCRPVGHDYLRRILALNLPAAAKIAEASRGV